MGERIFVWARRRPQGILDGIAKGVDEEPGGNPPPKTVAGSIPFTLITYSYVTIYSVEEDSVIVTTVVHGSRDFSALKF